MSYLIVKWNTIGKSGHGQSTDNRAAGIRPFSSRANASSKKGKVAIIVLPAWRALCYVAGENLATGRLNITFARFLDSSIGALRQ